MFYTSYWEAENLVTDVALYFSQSSPFGFSNLLTNLLYHVFRWEGTKDPQGLLFAITWWLWRLKEESAPLPLDCTPGLLADSHRFLQVDAERVLGCVLHSFTIVSLGVPQVFILLGYDTPAQTWVKHSWCCQPDFLTLKWSLYFQYQFVCYEFLISPIAYATI